MLESAGAVDALRQVAAFEAMQAEVRESQSKLTTVRDLASSLCEALKSLDQRAIAVLRAQYSGVDPVDWAEVLHDAADSALDSLGASGKGRPGEPRLKHAIWNLYILYRRCKPGSRGITAKPTTEDGYIGEFYCLVRNLLLLIGVKRTSGAIGKQIELAIRGTTKPQRSSPKKK